MTCGCKPSVSPVRVDIASRAAMCQTCPRSIKAADGSAITCTALGRPIEEIVVVGVECPDGRHPDAAGVVRWAGADWLGVPEPIRWRLVWDLGREPQGLIGCGCLAAVKASRAGPWLEPWLEGVQTLRTRLAGFMGDWRAAMVADAPVTTH
jgi:hypothetical protein